MSLTDIIAAITGRRIAEAAPDVTDVDVELLRNERDALAEQLATAQGQIRKLVHRLGEAETAQRVTQEQLTQARAARAAAAEPTCKHDAFTRALPAGEVEAALRRGAQDRRNAVQLEERLAIAEGRARTPNDEPAWGSA